ncbi:MarR family protein [Cnuella takakiae]|uniref:MarR family protein n=2 Tax=Cnuella takakiae TaxID=1302690 RepID=A0A1M4Z7X3_9BACT|nr:MarR family protein [Cnuella takakiae]
MAIGSRLRQLSERITEEATQIYQLYDINFQPRWFPVFYVLSDGTRKPITQIAKEIGHSHVSVSQIVKDMVKQGYVVEKSDPKDGRKTVVELSKMGKTVTSKLSDQLLDVNAAIEKALSETDHNLWKALEEWEHLLERKPLLQRVQEQRKERERSKVQIVDYTDEYLAAFRTLNQEWITTYFEMEEADYKALDHPRAYILDKGGAIFVALYEGEPLGVCALIKMEDGQSYELAKMAVSPKAQGKSIGHLLGRAVIEKAKLLGAKRVYLESNTVLKPAINLYYKLGFEKITGHPSPYERCNIQMEIKF